MTSPRGFFSGSYSLRRSVQRGIKTSLPAGVYRTLSRALSVKRALQSWPKQFTPLSREHTDRTSCIIANGLPKSGTYLLNRIVEYTGQWTKLPFHLNDEFIDVIRPDGTFSSRVCTAPAALCRIRDGQFVAAHIRANPAVITALTAGAPHRHLRHVFIYRDLRDTFVSMVNFMTRSAKNLTSPEGRLLNVFMRQKFPSDEARLSWLISTRSDWDFLGFAAWLTEPHTLAVRFEDLYSDVLAAREGAWGPVLRRLFAHIGLSCDDHDPRQLFAFVYGQGRTARATEEEKIGIYRTIFTPEHYRLFDTPHFRSAMEAFGYPTDECATTGTPHP